MLFFFRPLSNKEKNIWLGHQKKIGPWTITHGQKKNVLDKKKNVHHRRVSNPDRNENIARTLRCYSVRQKRF